MKKTGKINLWLQYLIPQRWFSRLMGKLACITQPKMLKNFHIQYFIRRYQVDLSEAMETDFKKYPDFNAFFTRKLMPLRRPIDAHPNSIVSPADGTISELGNIYQGMLIQAKKHRYQLRDLLGGEGVDEFKNSTFENGKFMTIYLSPKDYHRVHLPLAGKFLKQIHIPGQLFSVNPYTVDSVPNLFARNERIINFFDTSIGQIAVILVGAIIVGSIVMTAHENTDLEKGQELGYFQLGSTVIILLESAQTQWQKEFTVGTSLKMGEKIGNF